MLDNAQNWKTFSNCQATYQKELCLSFEKSVNFFSQGKCKDSIEPPSPVHFRSHFKYPSLLYIERTFSMTTHNYVKCQ